MGYLREISLTFGGHFEFMQIRQRFRGSRITVMKCLCILTDFCCLRGQYNMHVYLLQAEICDVSDFQRPSWIYAN